jgi:2-polyprenyl-3-methyl-5-hydroxy-6-metoxy-1,4-benzoquinol methylase
MREFDLSSLMKGLYQNMSYFAQIPLDGDAGFEENYHETTTDPDGKHRQLLEEREHSLAGIKEITDYLLGAVPGKILDVGCGLGWLLSSLDNSWDTHGIEISKFASNHAAKFGKIHNGTLEDFDEVLKFDLIVMNHVIEHLEDPVFALQKIYKLLKPGGTFIIGTPDFDSAAARRYGSNFRLLHDPTHISLFSSDSMHRCLRDHNFKINYVEYPFFDTPWFTESNLLRILNADGISPPFYGSAMTFFCERPL